MLAKPSTLLVGLDWIVGLDTCTPLVGLSELAAEAQCQRY